MHWNHHLARAMATLMVVGAVLGTAGPAAARTLVAVPSSAAAPATNAALADFGEAFHFLAPLGVESGDPTKFDASILNGLIVSICRVEGSACTPVKALTSASPLSERLRIGQTNGKDSYYLANWDVSKLKLEPSTFRVTVTIARLQLGSIDIGPATYKSFGRTWPIKFRIEKNPTIRVRVLNEAGKGASQIANAIRLEFGLCGDDVASLLANDLDPFSQKEIDLAIAGACQDAEIWPWTKIADQATGDALTSFDPTTGQMTFARSTPVLANLQAGDVLVGEPAAAAVAGYLRKITSITKNKKTGVIVVETTQALLNEAVKEGTLDAAADLKPADLVSSDTLPGVTLTSARPAPQRGPAAGGGYALVDIGDGLNFHETVDITLQGSASGDGVDGNGTVRIRGRVDFNAGWNIGMGIEACFEITLACVDRFEARVGADLYSDLKVDGVFNGRLQREVTLSTNYFSPIVFFIGPVPVVIVPVVKAIAGIDGDARVEFSFEAQVQSKFELGAKWTDPEDGGNDWQPVANIPVPPLTGDATGDLKATMNLRAYAKADAKLLLYGVAGPGVAGQLGMKARVQFPGNPLWQLYGYIKGEVNFAVDLGGILKLAEYRHTFLDEDVLLKESENQPPACGARTTPIPTDPAAETYLGPRAGFQGFFACTDPEGELVTYRAVDNLGDPVNLARAKWDLPGTYTVTVTATDADGKSTSFDLTVVVIESAPLLDLVTASTSVPAGVQYWVTASAFQPTREAGSSNGDFLPCTSLAWDVPGATISLDPSNRTCTALIVFSDPGAHTIRVTATGAFGRTSERLLNVNVTTAPANPAPVIEEDSFTVTSVTGPKIGCDPLGSSIDCLESCPSGFVCPVPMDAYLFNGMVGSYRGPLTFSIDRSDPNGDSLTVQWFCMSGEQSYRVTANSDGTWSCDPYSTSTTRPILLWAEISDGTTMVRSEVRRMYMFDRVG